jgi:hypothetical protein
MVMQHRFANTTEESQKVMQHRFANTTTTSFLEPLAHNCGKGCETDKTHWSLKCQWKECEACIECIRNSSFVISVSEPGSSSVVFEGASLAATTTSTTAVVDVEAAASSAILQAALTGILYLPLALRMIFL